ncbi:unnamed protein product [Trichobilharzia regenti]|nr:unnamed protein product [Trichobilharzia regenti]
MLSPYSPLSPPTKHLGNQNKKPVKTIRPITNTTGPASTTAASAVATTGNSMSSMCSTYNTVTSTTNGNTRHGVKALNKFSPLPSRFGDYREGSEPTEGALHRKLMKSDDDDDYAMSGAARRRAMSSSLIDINPGKNTFQSSMTTSTSTAYHQPNDDITQTTTLTPQGVGSSDGDLLCSSENNTVSPLHVSELNVNEPSSHQSHVIIVKDLSSIEKDDRKTNSTVPIRNGKDLSRGVVTNGNDSKYYGVTNGGEDEAFHEGNDDLYGDRYDDSVDESSLDNDNHFTRHAILEYHRTATLKRLTRRAGGGGGGGTQHTHDHKLTNGLTPSYRNIIIEYESDSITSIGTGAGGVNINSPVQDEPRVHKFTSSRINNNPNLSCELCQKKCQSIDNVVKCIECDLFCHEKCSSLDSKCFPTHMNSSPHQSETDKNGHVLLKRHDSAYLPSELDSYKKANHHHHQYAGDDDRGRSAPTFGITGGGSGLFSPTLPWRGERDHSFRSSLVLM